MEVEPPQSLIPSHSTREPSQACSGSQAILSSRDSILDLPQHQPESLPGTRWWRKGGCLVTQEHLGNVEKRVSATKCLITKPDLPQQDLVEQREILKITSGAFQLIISTV